MKRPSAFRGSLIVAFAAALAACATPATHYPDVSGPELARVRLETQREAAEAILADLARLQDLAWPLLAANARLCGKGDTARTLGLTLIDEDTAKGVVRGLKKSHVRALGYGDAPRILHAAAGGPAAAAGLKRGDRILTVAGEDVGDRSRRDLGRRIRETIEDLGDGEALVLAVADPDGARREVNLTPVETCDFPVRLRVTSTVNAYTDGSEITVTSSFLREVPDDDLLRFVLSHELAHAGLDHSGKLTRNLFVSGGIVVLPVTAILGGVADIIVGVAPGPDPVRPLGATATTHVANAMLGIEKFEREADYAGLYMYARAGGDMAGLEDVWAALARVSPLNTWGAITHPTTPERVLALRRTRDEILAKAARREPLIPDGLSIAEDAEEKPGP